MFLGILFPEVLSAQSFWTKIAGDNSVKNIASQELIQLDLNSFASYIRSAPVENMTGNVKGIPVTLPLPGGKMLHTTIVESPLLKLEENTEVNIRTYSLIDASTNSSNGRISVTPFGINGILFTEDGTVYINPVSTLADGRHQVSFTNEMPNHGFPCSVGNVELSEPGNIFKIAAGDGRRRTYRLAIATTGEYTNWAGSRANAIMYFTISLNNVAAIYSRDLNVSFSVFTRDTLLFLDGATDPFIQTGWEEAVVSANQTLMDNAIGSANYDLAMVFNRGWDKGYAWPFGTVCNPTQKARSASGLTYGTGMNPVAGPQGPTFDFTIAHEMGHQFGASHTMASNAGFCAGNATAATAYEPGAGNTVMSYAGYSNCGTYVNYIEPYFHAGTIQQIQTYILANACGAVSSAYNSAPVVSVVGSSYTIPISTPFTLTGRAHDAEGNQLLYNWEQMNPALTATPPPGNHTTGPNFRSYPPNTNGHTRSFPGMRDIAANVSPLYEVLPTVTRTMNFRLTARDQSALGPNTGEGNVVVNTNAGAGPFIVTSQPGIVTWTANGTNTQTINWNVANTTAAPVSCASVTILFSVDGGITFPYTLITSTPNDGTEIITVPNLPTSAGRVKVQALNNIFFNINKANITVTSACSANGTTLSRGDSISAPANHASLNLSLVPEYGNSFLPSGTLTASNPSTVTPIFKSDMPGCAYYGNDASTKYNVHPFMVSNAGNYTFSFAHGPVYNIYSEKFDPGFPCLNFIASNTVTNATTTTINTSVSAYLAPGNKYVLMVGTYTATFPVLPVNYSVSVSGGTLYTNTPNPGASYSYFYVVVDNATNTIKAITSTPDLSNGSTYPAGTSYTIYGLSYSNASPALAGFVNGNFVTLANALLYDATLCGNLSRNSFKVKVIHPVYTFIGTGNWNVASNWLNNAVPPSPLPAGSEIIIDPAVSTESVLNIPMTIQAGGKLTVVAGKKLVVNGNLLIQN